MTTKGKRKRDFFSSKITTIFFPTMGKKKGMKASPLHGCFLSYNKEKNNWHSSNNGNIQENFRDLKEGFLRVCLYVKLSISFKNHKLSERKVQNSFLYIRLLHLKNGNFSFPDARKREKFRVQFSQLIFGPLNNDQVK